MRVAARPKKPRSAVPVGMLALLMLAFGGSLVLKAVEERQFADGAMLTQQLREAETLAGHVRADLIALKARMEGLLQTGATLEVVRRNMEFEAVRERDPPPGAWVRLDESGGVRVFAKNPQGRWISGVSSKNAMLPQALDGRDFQLVTAGTIPMTARYEDVNFQRSSVACAPVANSGIAACVFRPAPLFGLGDLNRLVIYGLLLAAPLLAVFGLVGAIRRVERDRIEAQARADAMSGTPTPGWTSFEAPGMTGLWRWDPITQLLTIGPEACALVGANHAGEMTLDEFTTNVAEDCRQRVREAIETASKNSQISLSFQGVGRMSSRYFEMIGATSDGVLAGAVLSVTDRVQAQAHSRKAEAVARTALDAYPGPFALWNSHKRLTHWNAAFGRVFNLDRKLLHAGASYDLIMSEVARFVRVERPLGDDANAREMQLLSDQWVRLVDRRTASDGLITVGLDISDLKKQGAVLQRNDRRLRAMVEELERARGQAEELAQTAADATRTAERANQVKTTFLGNVGHELRTPLNHINGFAQMIAQQIYGPLGSPRYLEYAEDIVGAAKHLEDMINDILDMSKFEAGKMRLSATRIDPIDPVDGAVKLARRRAADRELSLIFDPDDDVPEIDGDHRAIKQMTFNLITNSIKFTDAGGEIRVTVTHEGNWVLIRVADTGIGIAPEDLPRLAQPFEQVTTPEAKGRNLKGTGLGLALTKSFAELHGGRLTLESKLGEGTQVTVYLPVERQPLHTAMAARTVTAVEQKRVGKTFPADA